MVNRLVTTMKNLARIINFICAKPQLYQCDHWLPAFTAIKLKKIEQIIHIYKKLFQSTHFRGVSLASEYCIDERWSQSCAQQIIWNNIPSKTDEVYVQDI